MKTTDSKVHVIGVFMYSPMSLNRV